MDAQRNPEEDLTMTTNTSAVEFATEDQVKELERVIHPSIAGISADAAARLSSIPDLVAKFYERSMRLMQEQLGSRYSVIVNYDQGMQALIDAGGYASVSPSFVGQVRLALRAGGGSVQKDVWVVQLDDELTEPYLVKSKLNDLGLEPANVMEFLALLAKYSSQQLPPRNLIALARGHTGHCPIMSNFGPNFRDEPRKLDTWYMQDGGPLICEAKNFAWVAVRKK